MQPIVLLTEDQLQYFIEAMTIRISEIIKETNQSKVNSKEYLTTKEVLDLLKITNVTLHEWCSKGIISKSKVGSRLRFRYDEIIDAIQRIESKKKR